MRLRPLALSIVLLACASFARADAVRLIAPAAGVTLHGGATSELEWSATDLPPGTEEWEAFLSVDGGKYYAFRVTPHLDVERQRFTFVVPNVDTNDARIMIRTGDELHETHFESPASFSIARDVHAEAIASSPSHFLHGEAAREGDREVLFWTEGSRDGSGLRSRSSTAASSASIHRIAAPALDSTEALQPEVGSLFARDGVTVRQFATQSRTWKREPLRRSVDLLLVCRRRNI